MDYKEILFTDVDAAVCNKNSTKIIPPVTKKVALVVEGGGMRTIFAAGVMDRFFELDFDPFDLYLGVSAGSLNLISHLAGEFHRNYRMMMHSAKSGQFISGWKYLRGGHYVDLDWLCEQHLELPQMDKQLAMQKLKNSGKKFVVVCTDINTGKAKYYNPDKDNINLILKGSSCIPFLYRKPVYIAGTQVVDGGISDPLPVKKAYDEGATEIVVIRSRERNYHEPENSLDKIIGSYFYKRYPKLQQSILDQAKIYNESMDFIDKPPRDINIIQIAPTRVIGTNFITTDPELLEKDYQHGYQLGGDFARHWLAMSTEKISMDEKTNNCNDVHYSYPNGCNHS